ncbi:Chitin synthase [Aphelenchoides besseyi]|nr:Chitin synthase [Aphelenchoides besseyi]
MGFNGERHWDSFRSIPRSERQSEKDAEIRYTYWLQCVKLFVFMMASIFCLIGTFLSKSIVYVLATNILVIPTGKSIAYQQSCGSSKHPQNVTHFAFACASLWIIHTAPDLFAFVQNLWKMMKTRQKSFQVIYMIVFFESCRSAGLTLLTMGVFPLLDVPRCVLLSCGIVMLAYLRRVFYYIWRSLMDRRSPITRRFCWLMYSVPICLCFIIMASSSMVYAWQDFDNKFHRILPTALILCAIGYWECWIHVESANGIFHEAFEVKYGIRKLNRETRICAAVSRLVCASIVLYWSLRHHSVPVGHLIRSFVHWNTFEDEGRLFVLAYIAVFINFMLRQCSRFLAAMKLQLLPMFHPVFIMPPVLFLFYYSICHWFPVCAINRWIHPFGLGLACQKEATGGGAIPDSYLTPFYMLFYLIWAYGTVRGSDFAAKDEVIESMPAMLVGLDVNQSQIVFRHAVCQKDINDLVEDEEEVGDLKIINSEVDKTVILYVCATMWHETRTEMTQMIKSIHRLDEEQAIRLAEKATEDRIKFKLEVHIFLDDAWEDDSECGRVPNQYFRLLFDILMEVTKTMSEEPHSRFLLNTSYGGRLVLKLNCGTLLFVHLKDKLLIRNKKRWSQVGLRLISINPNLFQVMYMYYLLGHRIMDSHMDAEDRRLQAENTYLLAIDGDSKFVPSAVIKLLHLMSIKSDIGCACGRIHPIGEGVMVWYQKFEYAIAHWFQKAAEHVFGCVLCAPGCFSLFRASALMDDNVMHKYTKTATEPRHFVQYDQGEDRWLSTLLLKQGYRIEYAAASDAETYAPEGFEEFFNQRRRWTPSSIANTIDLLADYKLAAKNNESISMAYILYQMTVIGFSMLGPAIIFSMLVYAQVSAFAMDSARVLFYNATPVCLFIASCFLFDSSVQLIFAKVASVCYAFIMLAVLIATTNQIVLETMFSPTSMFVLAMVSIFMISSLIHPKEFANVVFGLVFFLMIPSTYVFLTLYSLINLNVINWGTREAVAKAIGNQEHHENFLERWLRKLGAQDENSLISRLLNCCSKPSLETQIGEHEAVKALERKFERTERMLAQLKEEMPSTENKVYRNTLTAVTTIDDCERVETCQIRRHNSTTALSRPNVHLGYQTRSQWMDAEYLQCCERGRLKPAEEQFWDGLIDKYLKPLDRSNAEEKEVATGLAALRNRIAFSLILLNGLLVLAVFLLQRHKDVLSVKFIPYEGFTWTKMNETTGKFEKTTEALKVDPLGIGIIFFLFGILIIQTVGMVIHRLNTLVEALHEISELEVVKLASAKFQQHQSVLEEARHMLDSAYYEMAHGGEGFVRRGIGITSV